jgi:hypothetical protein
MEMFFKIGTALVDVEEGHIADTEKGKVMKIDFTSMTVKLFSATTKLTPIRFHGEKELLVWNSVRNRWYPLKSGLHIDIQAAIIKLIEVRIEKELLG